MAEHAQSPQETPQAHLLRLVNGYRITQLLYVAARLGIADHLARGPMDIDGLATVVGAHAGALFRALRALASVGVFAEVAPRTFTLTPAAEFLRADHPASLRSHVVFNGGEAYRAWADLLYSAQTGKPAMDHVFGVSHFAYLASNPEANEIFNQTMSANSRRSNAAVVSALEVGAGQLVVDVGGGEGALLSAVLAAHPQSRGILFDQPHVLEGAQARLEAAGVAARCERVAGDFFASPIPSGDVYLLRQIIHDWDDERARMILRNCAQAMPPSGKIVVIEALIPPGNGPSPAKLLDLQMLVMNGGRQRTEDEYRQLFAAAGLRLTQVVPTASDLSLVEGVKAE